MAQAILTRGSRYHLFRSLVLCRSNFEMSAMQGALRLSRRSLMRIELPEFSKSRFARRANMMDEDRIKWYNWNLACIGLTTVPLVWMYTVNYRTCEEVETLNRTLNPMGTEKVKYDLRMYG